jgi:hypothetical protein
VATVREVLDMTKWHTMALLGFAVACPAVVQGEQPRPCALPEAAQFDFWLGEWALEWGEDGRGRNVITKSLDDCVIVERFDGTPSIPLRGMSMSVYDARLGQWRQTWVDNQGGYLDFGGGFADSRMVLVRHTTIDGKEVLQRMVWHEISDHGLLWNWERSDDGGEHWQVLWQIRYTRAE